jgi:hypothetical protein
VINRDFDRRTFTLESEYHAGLPFAQAWLIARGCPPERITLPDGMFIEPADSLTLRIEQKIMDSTHRYEVLGTYTRDQAPYESWTLVRDSRAAQDPVRVFLERGDPEAFTSTLREGAFPDAGSAQEWLDRRSSPLPEAAPEDLMSDDAPRTRAALTRSAGQAGRAACGLDGIARPSAPPTPPAPPQDRGRLL